MTELSKEILEKWQIRKTRKQKTDFINFLKGKVEGVKVEEGGLFRSRNIVIGDVEGAKVIFGAHYDTCVRLFFPNFLTPKNFLIYLAYNIFITAGLFFLCSLVLVISYILTKNIDFAGWLFTASLWGVMFLMLFGPANKHTANDNTSGVVAALEIYNRLTNEQRKKVAFVLFDHEESGLFGSLAFSKAHKKALKDKLFVNLDCVSDGDNIMVIRNKSARAHYDDIIREGFESDTNKHILFEKASRVIYPSDQLHFPCYIAIAAFKRNKIFGLYINKIHTSKDVHFDWCNIGYICNSAVKLINKA